MNDISNLGLNCYFIKGVDISEDQITFNYVIESSDFSNDYNESNTVICDLNLLLHDISYEKIKHILKPIRSKGYKLTTRVYYDDLKAYKFCYEKIFTIYGGDIDG